MILSICDVPEILRVMRIVNIIITIIRIAVPILLIASAMIGYMNAVKDNDTDALQKTNKTTVVKLVAAILVFLIPTFVSIIAGVFNNGEYKNCIGNITLEDINKAFVAREEELVKKAEETTNINDYNNALNYLNNVPGDKKSAYLERLKKVKEVIDERNKKEREERLTPPVMTGTIEGEKGKYTFPGLGNQYTKINVQGQDYYVVNTKTSVNSYASYARNNKIFQGARPDEYSDFCLGFSYVHSWELFSGRRTFDPDSMGNGADAAYFRSYVDTDLSKVMNVLYSEITNGRPVIIQVNGNLQGTGRHFVSVVGFKTSVTNPSTMQGTDLLILDSYDARVERMDQPKSRFLTTGEQTRKNYKGYYLLYLREQYWQSGNTSNNNSNSNGSNNQTTYGCVNDPADTKWYSCFKGSHDLVVPSLGPQGANVTMKVGETRSFQVNLPSECGTLVKWTRTTADGDNNWNNYATQSRSNITNTGFTWTVTAKKAGSTILSQTVEYDTKSPSGKCTLTAKSMYKFNLKITN